MVGQIPGLLKLEANAPLASTASRGKGFNMGLVAVLEKADDVGVYAEHPAHLAYVFLSCTSFAPLLHLSCICYGVFYGLFYGVFYGVFYFHSSLCRIISLGILPTYYGVICMFMSWYMLRLYGRLYSC